MVSFCAAVRTFSAYCGGIRCGGIGGEDALDDRAFVGIAGDDGDGAGCGGFQRFFAAVEAHARHARALIRSMAAKAGIRHDGPDIAIELDRFGGRPSRPDWRPAGWFVPGAACRICYNVARRVGFAAVPPWPQWSFDASSLPIRARSSAISRSLVSSAASTFSAQSSMRPLQRLPVCHSAAWRSKARRPACRSRGSPARSPRGALGESKSRRLGAPVPGSPLGP